MDRTAPIVHSSSQEQDSLFKRIRSGMETRAGKLAASTVILFGAATLSACAGEANAQGPVKNDTDTSVSTPEATPTESTDTQETVDTSELFGTVVEQTKSIEEMDAITDLSEFAKLGIGDRVAYAIDKVGLEAFPLDGTNEDAFENEAWSIPGAFWQQANGYAYNNADPLVRAKLASSYAYYTTDPATGEISSEYQAAADDAVQYGGEGIGGPLLMVHVANGEPQDGLDRDGNEIHFMNITYKKGTNETIDSSTEIKTAQAIRVNVKLASGKTVVTYALGYATDGQESPVEQYPY